MLVYVFKLRGKPEQVAAIDEAIRTVQFIRNKAIRFWMDHRGSSKYDLSKLASTLAAEFPFVRKLNSTARQQATERAWSSAAKFFDNCKKKVPGKKGYPKFQQDNRSVEYKQSGWKLTDDCRFITFTDGHGIGTLKLIGKQALNAFQDKIQRVQIVRRADGYYAHFVLKIDRQETVPASGSIIGLDLGLTYLWTDSNGDQQANPRTLRRAEKALKRTQRQISSKQKGSKNRQKQIQKLARKHLKVSRQRKDFAIKSARALCQSHDLVVLEDLKVRNLVRNHHLAKSISDAGWSMLKDWIQYFAKLFGTVCVLVPPDYSTQECHACGARERKPLSQRWHCCPCGCSMDRDQNAALVLLQRGLKQLEKGTRGHRGTQTETFETPVDRWASARSRKRLPVSSLGEARVRECGFRKEAGTPFIHGGEDVRDSWF